MGKRSKSYPKPAPARKRASVALVLKRSLELSRQEHRAAVLDPRNTLTDDISLGMLGLVEVILTDREELVLSEPVPIDDVQIKPTGQPYLSHPGYTRWLNRAFGRFGWSIVPASKPMRSGSAVVCPYVLYIHKQPAAFAIGEQEYFESNKDQTYGDALESTVASALRRCCKRRGIGLELWDRKWLNKFIHDRAVKVRVTVKRDGEEKVGYHWRLKTDPPLWNELPGKASADDRPDVGTPPVASHAKEGEPITDAQRRRLWTMLTHSGRDEQTFKAWLAVAYDLDSTKKITRRDYDAICAAIEAPGPLPAPRGK